MTKLRASTTSETIQYRYTSCCTCKKEEKTSQTLLYLHTFNTSCFTLDRWSVASVWETVATADSRLSRHGCLIAGLLVCRKAVKATLVLLPLLGITYMLFFVNPGEDEISQIVFIYFNSFLESFQVRFSSRTSQRLSDRVYCRLCVGVFFLK